MRKLSTVLGGFVMSVFLLVIPLGCSDNDNSSSPIPPNVPTNRVYVMTMDSGILSPVVESAGEKTVYTADESWEYTLTLRPLNFKKNGQNGPSGENLTRFVRKFQFPAKVLLSHFSPI